MKNIKKLIIIFLTFCIFIISACDKNIESDMTSEVQINDKSNEDLVKRYAGKYVRKYVEEIEGEDIIIVDSIILKEDMTCIFDFQDIVEGVWDLEGNVNAGGSYNSYSIEGDKLIFTRGDDGTIFEFIKE